jgi:hypothetical protein
MVTARSERPRFFDGQYIGAADLAAAVDYARELSREAALAGQSWGICIGLDLVEVANGSGSFDYFILPGLAFDGYGRPIVVLAPAPVPAALFADFPTGNQSVWLRYDEAQTRGLRPGWESCDANDAYARVRESYAIEAGPMTAIKDRQSGVEIAGVVIEDARLGLNSIDAEAPLVCDGSMPHQTFPADNARWLVPVGAASWTQGAPGSLGERSADAKKFSRTLRRYVGQVAESLYAADGVLRLRDRMTDRDDTKTPDDQCTATSVRTDDLTNAVDPKDSGQTLDRLIGKELVWVEGHMRVTGDARLWGTKLELRKADGSADIPLHLTRAAVANALGGQDLELAIGIEGDGKSRLLAGIAPAGLPFSARMQLRNDGRLAVGPVIPADVKTHSILAHTEEHTSIAVAAGAAKLAKLQFATAGALTETAHLAYDGDTDLLRLGSSADLADYLYITTVGKVGIRTDEIDKVDISANDLVVRSPGPAGISIFSDAGSSGRLNFGDDIDDPTRHRNGCLVYNNGFARMEFWTGGASRVAIGGTGNVGIGTMSPSSRLQIHSTTDGRALRLDADRIQADNGGPASQLGLQPGGGGVVINGSLSADQQVAIGGDGRIGMGTTGPAGALHIRNGNPNLILETTSGTSPRLSLMSAGITRSTLEVDTGTARTRLTSNGATAVTVEGNRVGVNIGGNAPVANLHVQGNVAGDAADPGAHVAFIDNQAGFNADVLALRVGAGAPDGSSNFITFFGGAAILGRIEGNSGGISFLSGSGDFAECLRRSEADETIGPGRIVGVHGGRISLRTEGADSLMVTTDRAAVVGNVPDKGEDGWERVAMLGQVPVHVDGPVAAGDYVLPSGKGDGVGRAVRPDRLAPADAVHVVGRAWEASDASDPKRVNVAVGMAGAMAADAMAAAFATQAETIARLEVQLAALAARLEG